MNLIFSRSYKAGFLFLFSLIFFAGGYCQETTISFDDKAPKSTPGANGYSRLGVLFPLGAVIESNPNIAHSRNNILVSNDIQREFDQDPLTIIFTFDVISVKLFTGIPYGSNGKPIHIVLNAYDGSNNPAGSTSIDVTGPTSISKEMQLRVQPGKTIRKIALNAGNNFEYIDDLSFTSAGNPLPPQPGKPVIRLSAPAPGSSTEDGNLLISGTIDGAGIYPDINRPALKISYPVDPAGQQPSTLNTYVNLNTISTDHYTFSLPYKLSNLGLNTISIEIAGTGGTAKAQASVSYMPLSIRNKYQESGGSGTLGNFIWGTSDGGCVFAVYQKGVIFSSSKGTYAVTDPIFSKWKSLKSTVSQTGLLGYAIGNIRTGANDQSQNFSGGRIYSSSLGSYYMVEPFLSAVDKLDFVTHFGPPASDPDKRSDPALPRMWQKFSKRFGGEIRISTMELTENPWTLWTATPDIKGAELAGVNVSPRTSTVWHHYSCTSLNGTCNIRPETVPPRIDPAVLLRACGRGGVAGSRVYPWCVSCNQWESVQSGKIIPLLGTVKESHKSGKDYWLDHYCRGPRVDYPADWCTQVIPDPEFENLIRPSDNQIEVEFEWCLTGFPLSDNGSTDPSKAKLAPQPGDRIFFAGRYVADCAHDNAKPEIHPPAVLLNTYTEGSGTRGDIVYFPWWYAGESVEVDIYPPPRPSPDARLYATIPVGDEVSAIRFDGLNWTDVTLGTEGKYLPSISPNHLTLRLTGLSNADKPPVVHRGAINHRPGTIGEFLVFWKKL